MIEDMIVSFTMMSGLIFGYLFFMKWLKWFNDNYEIRRKNDK